jgi:exopolysaccharide production protein ExoY
MKTLKLMLRCLHERRYPSESCCDAEDGLPLGVGSGNFISPVSAFLVERGIIAGKARPDKNRSLDSGNLHRDLRHPLTVQFFLMRLIDIVLSLTLIVFLVPAFAVIALLIKLGDNGPVLFTQERVGYKGRFFPCYKFRSMRPNSDHMLDAYLQANPAEAENWQIYRKLKHDPRVTTTGRLLRKSSLDEFPQLFNVLKGEMSLVGPRPILPGEITKYGRSLRIYQQVRPGITGLWQIMGRNHLSYRSRVALDRIYVRKQSIGLYFYILFMTIPAVVMQRGSH